MILRHRLFGAVEKIENHFAEEGKAGRAVAIDLLLFVTVHEEEFVAGFLAGESDVFANLNGSFRADDEGGVKR